MVNLSGVVFALIPEDLEQAVRECQGTHRGVEFYDPNGISGCMCVEVDDGDYKTCVGKEMSKTRKILEKAQGFGGGILRKIGIKNAPGHNDLNAGSCSAAKDSKKDCTKDRFKKCCPIICEMCTRSPVLTCDGYLDMTCSMTKRKFVEWLTAIPFILFFPAIFTTFFGLLNSLISFIFLRKNHFHTRLLAIVGKTLLTVVSLSSGLSFALMRTHEWSEGSTDPPAFQLWVHNADKLNHIKSIKERLSVRKYPQFHTFAMYGGMLVSLIGIVLMAVAEIMKKFVYAISMEFVGVTLSIISGGAMLTSFAMLIYDSHLVGRDYFMWVGIKGPVNFGLLIWDNLDKLSEARSAIFPPLTHPEELDGILDEDGMKDVEQLKFEIKYWAGIRSRMQISKLINWMYQQRHDIGFMKNDGSTTWMQKREQMRLMKLGYDTTASVDGLTSKMTTGLKLGITIKKGKKVGKEVVKILR